MKQNKRRVADDIKDVTRQSLLYKIRQMSSLRNRALASFIYLTGCRISEIVGKEKGIPIYETNAITGKNEKIGDKKIKILPLTKESIEFMTENIILVQNVASLKWRDKVPRRNIPMKVSSDGEFISIFMNYYMDLKPGEPLFKMTRQRAWQIINDELGLFTHYLIHQRCTDLVTRKNISDLYLKKLRGWKDTRPAEVYTHLQWEDLAEKL